MPKESESIMPEIATPEEILRTFTQIMRGELTESSGAPKVSERSKAAELLGKRYGLFSEKEAAPTPRDEIAAEIDKALKELLHQHEQANT